MTDSTYLFGCSLIVAAIAAHGCLTGCGGAPFTALQGESHVDAATMVDAAMAQEAGDPDAPQDPPDRGVGVPDGSELAPLDAGVVSVEGAPDAVTSDAEGGAQDSASPDTGDPAACTLPRLLADCRGNALALPTAYPILWPSGCGQHATDPACQSCATFTCACLSTNRDDACSGTGKWTCDEAGGYPVVTCR